MIDINTFYGKTPLGQDHPLEAVLGTMKRFGVEYALLSSLKSAYYGGIESEEETLDLCRENPSLLPVAAVDLRGSFDPEEKATHLKKAGFAAARFFYEVNHISLDTPLFCDFAAAAEACSLPILTSAPARMVLAALQPMGPLTVPIVLLGQSAYGNYDVIGAMRRRENLFLEVRNFNGPDVLEYLARKVGDHRLLFGSCAPMEYLLPSRNMIEYSRLPRESRDRVLDGNARRLFAIGKEA